MMKTEFRVTDAETGFTKKAVVHSYISQTIFMIQGKSMMHDNTFCRDFFYRNVLKTYINKIMKEKGLEIIFMNQVLSGQNPKRKMPEKN